MTKRLATLLLTAALACATLVTPVAAEPRQEFWNIAFTAPTAGAAYTRLYQEREKVWHALGDPSVISIELIDADPRPDHVRLVPDPTISQLDDFSILQWIFNGFYEAGRKTLTAIDLAGGVPRNKQIMVLFTGTTDGATFTVSLIDR